MIEEQFMKVTLELGGGESQELTVPKGSTLADLRAGGFLKPSPGTGTVLYNGQPVSAAQEGTQAISEGAVITVLPIAAKQGK